jgi:excisionase family DNA binding protein
MFTVRMDSLLTVTEVSERLNLRPSTIRVWISKSKLAHLKLGRSVRVPESEVARVMRRVPSPRDPEVWLPPLENQRTRSRRINKPRTASMTISWRRDIQSGSQKGQYGGLL